MIRDITLGQYYPAKSVIHQLDPRVKLVATMLYIISLFVAKGILGYVIATIFLAFVIRTSKVPFKFITKGLKFIGRFGYDTYNENNIRRVKWPELYKAENYRDTNGNLIFTRVSEEKKMTQSSGSNGNRKEFFEWELHYNRGFNDHHTGAVLKYTQSSKVFTQGIGSDLKNGIARRNQGIAGRVNYNWKYR